MIPPVYHIFVVNADEDAGSSVTVTRGLLLTMAHTSAMNVASTSCVRFTFFNIEHHVILNPSSYTNQSFP